MLKNFLRILKSRDVDYWLTSVKKDGVEYAVLGYRIPGHPDGFAIMRRGNRLLRPEDVMKMHRGCLMGRRLNLARLGYVRIYDDGWGGWCLDENLNITPPKNKTSYIVCTKTGEVYPEFYGSRHSTHICKSGCPELEEQKGHYIACESPLEYKYWYCLGDEVFFTASRNSVIAAATRLIRQAERK